MPRSFLLAAPMAATLLIACTPAADQQAGAANAPGPVVRAVLKDAKGTPHGEAVIADDGRGGLILDLSVTGIAPGPHGVHIHAVGDCSAQDFTSAGPHWNPHEKAHGLNNPGGHHAGDMPNLTIGADGTGALQHMLPLAPLYDAKGAMMDTDGAAFIVHAAADDQKSDPAGNAGARILCGVFEARPSELG